MIDFMNERGLIDIWRVSNPNTKEFTWKKKYGSLQSRTDMWLISESLSYSDCKVEITPTPQTDHKAILPTLNMSHRVHEKTSAYWKLNNSLLLDESLNLLIKNKIFLNT